MNFNWDKIWLGLLAGLVAPFIGFLGYYQLHFAGMGIPYFINYLIQGKVYTPMVSLSVVANLPVFFIFIWTNKNQSARGVLFSTFIYAAIVVYLKYFL